MKLHDTGSAVPITRALYVYFKKKEFDSSIEILGLMQN